MSLYSTNGGENKDAFVSIKGIKRFRTLKDYTVFTDTLREIHVFNFFAIFDQINFFSYFLVRNSCSIFLDILKNYVLTIFYTKKIGKIFVDNFLL